MNTLFAETLRKLRREKGFSQIQLADQMFVNKSTIARSLLSTAAESDKSLNIIIVDDNKAIIADSLFVLEEVVPTATITGFNWPQEAIEYAKVNRIDLAVLDIEMGTANGLDLCHELLGINPCIKVIYLTAYPDYALDAWDTDACGFMVKPLTPEGVRRQLKKLRCSFSMGGSGE